MTAGESKGVVAVLVEQWAADRERCEPNSDKPVRARKIADDMRRFKAAHPEMGMAELPTARTPEPESIDERVEHYAEAVEAIRRKLDEVGPLTEPESAAMRGLIVAARDAVKAARTPEHPPGADAAREVIAKLIAAAERVNGDHVAPHDCYATGPLTGDPHRDLVECPGCQLDAALTKVRELMP